MWQQQPQLTLSPGGWSINLLAQGLWPIWHIVSLDPTSVPAPAKYQQNHAQMWQTTERQTERQTDHVMKKWVAINLVITKRFNSLYNGLLLLYSADYNPRDSAHAVLTNKSVRMCMISWWSGRYTRHYHLSTAALTVVQL